MHYTGTIWRPPYEANSLLLEVTIGCTHHRCKFCTLYSGLPAPFRLSPLADVEADLLEAQTALHSPRLRAEARMQGLPDPAAAVRRVYLVGGNPFVLSFRRLETLAERIHAYFPACRTIGCFARVTDMANKSDQELRQLARLGYDGLTIGVEIADRLALAFMDKGYGPEDILTQCRRLDEAGIGYHFFYLAGISGAGRGEEGAKLSAALFNQLRPQRLGVSMLTVYQNSRLCGEIQAGRWQEAGELEKLRELEILAGCLEIPIWLAALGASNAVPIQGTLPQDRERLLRTLQEAQATLREEELRRYRVTLPHL